MSQNTIEIAKLVVTGDKAKAIEIEFDRMAKHTGKWSHSVLYWAKYFDPWLMRISYWKPQHLSGVSFKQLRHDTSTLLAVAPKSVLRAPIKVLLARRKFQYQESKWYLWHLNEAAQAFREFNDISRIFIRVTPVAASDGDEQYRSGLRGR